MRSEIEGHDGSGYIVHRELEELSPYSKAAVSVCDDDILDVVAKTRQVSMRDHHREADDAAFMSNDVDLGR